MKVNVASSFIAQHTARQKYRRPGRLHTNNPGLFKIEDGGKSEYCNYFQDFSS